MTDPSSDGARPVMELVQALYTELALHPEKDFGWGKGQDNARSLGYCQQWLNRLPAVVWESAAAVGNPFSLGPINLGETVVDLGCGAGADLCIAALLGATRGALSESILPQQWSRRPKGRQD
jgi:arsenite methyltransferase